MELDVHTHLAPIAPARLRGLPGVEWRTGEGCLLLDGRRIGPPALFAPQRLIDWLDQRGIERALVSIPPPLYRQHLSAEQALRWTHYLNEELLAIAHASQGRLRALLHLPLEHPSLLAPLLHSLPCEANETSDSHTNTPGPPQGPGAYAGMALAAGGHLGIAYADPHYAPLWEWLHARAAWTFIHPGPCADVRLSRLYLENLVGNPYETGLAAAELLLAGIPARYPRIRFCLAHAGGMLTSMLGRLQRGFDTQRPGLDPTLEPPLQAARRLYTDHLAHHPSTLLCAQTLFGPDHVLFGSDWPFPMGVGENKFTPFQYL